MVICHANKTMGRNVVFGCAGVCGEGRNESSPKNACVGDDIGNHFRTKALSKTSHEIINYAKVLR